MHTKPDNSGLLYVRVEGIVAAPTFVVKYVLFDDDDAFYYCDKMVDKYYPIEDIDDHHSIGYY